MKLSGIIITKNEQTMIEACISSLTFCDEVVVIDSGSSDQTITLARQLGAVAFVLESGDFSRLRNYGKEKARGEWVIYIDADERVSKELANEIATVIQYPEKTVSGYKVMRVNIYYKNYTWSQVEELERLFKKDNLQKWQGKLHETAVVDGKIGVLHQTLLHYSRRSITAMVEKTIVWSQVEAQLRLQANHPKMTWWRFPRVLITGFLKAYIKDGGYRMGTAGFVESIYQSFSMLITYAKLWEMQSLSKSKNNLYDEI